MKTNCECEGKTHQSDMPDKGLFTAAQVTDLLKRLFNRPTAKGHSLRGNLAAGMRRETYEGKPFLVVPVVMARNGVVMNGSLTDINEFLPASWDGVPVTLSHPEVNGSFASANTPENLTKFGLGRIFNAKIEDNSLKAEAWIDIERASKLDSTLVAKLESGQAMDVSTGYFCDDYPDDGIASNGEHYEVVSRNIKPNHLAFLPNEAGACSWADGCGVRANVNSNTEKRMTLKERLNTAVGVILTSVGVKADDPKVIAANIDATLEKAVVNERGNDDDHRQMRADLISNDKSPFTPDDEDALRMMSPATLKKMRDLHAPVANAAKVDPEDAADGGDDEAAEGEPALKKKSKKSNQEQEVTMNREEIVAIVTEAVAQSIKAHSAAAAPVLSAEDKAALARANKMVADEKKKLIAHIVSNSAITEVQAQAMEMATLEVVAAGIQPVANYGGKALPNFNSDADQSLKDMIPTGTLGAIKARAARKEAH